MFTRFLVFLILFLPCVSFIQGDIGNTPVLHNGRIRPLEVYARLWLFDRYHSENIKKEDRNRFPFEDPTALNFFLLAHGIGILPFADFPLYWIKSYELKKNLGIDINRMRFSFNQLEPLIEKAGQIGSKGAEEEWKKIRSLLLQDKQHVPFLAIPSRFKKDKWLDLSSLAKSTVNKTAYSDTQYALIRKAYVNFRENIDSVQARNELHEQLMEGYSALAGKPSLKAHGKTLHFPTMNQIRLERLYYHLPLIELAMLLYLAGSILLILGRGRFGAFALAAAFALHTIIIAARCFILLRPPVSNMFESVLYVPWFATLAALLLSYFQPYRWTLISAGILSTGLLALVKLSQLNSSMENVQAVLDSQYWLIIHVLLVVGSYGVFLLSGICGHIYLVKFSRQGESEATRSLGRIILQTMYIGLAMLIPGTILGGVWAAESWGRFWDWDPKESWAFISSCIYLIWVHGFTFGKISYYGLAAGSIAGLAAISFTWYGVNYILGTGLHSYGFGDGGQIFYYLFLLAEAAFLAINFTLKKRNIKYEKKLFP